MIIFAKPNERKMSMRTHFRSVLALLTALTLLLSMLPAAASAEKMLEEATPAEPVQESPIPADPQLSAVPESEVKLPEMKRSDTGYIWMENVGGTALTDAYLAAQASGTAEPQDTACPPTTAARTRAGSPLSAPKAPMAPAEPTPRWHPSRPT